jgi:hypothetical protein
VSNRGVARLAGSKVTRRSVASEIATILDSPEVAALVAELDALRWVGRKGYGARTMLGACLVKTLYAIPTWTRVADLIAEHPGLEAALGGAPSHWACYRFARKLRTERERISVCLDALAASLREHYPDMGQEVAIDASDMPAYTNGQRYLYKDGPERQTYSDPDASWGTAAPSRPGRAAASTAIASTPPSAPRRAFRLRGRSRRLGAMSPTTPLRCSTRFALAASRPRRARWTWVTTTTGSTTRPASAAVSPSFR